MKHRTFLGLFLWLYIIYINLKFNKIKEEYKEVQK